MTSANHSRYTSFINKDEGHSNFKDDYEVAMFGTPAGDGADVELELDSEQDEKCDSDLEDIFLDAIGEIESTVQMNEEQVQAMTHRRMTAVCDEKEISAWSGKYADLATQEEPAERDKLPWFKDPSLKAGLWAILKDNIGKDLSKIALPVTFNEPISLT